jgi:type I restriction enzyme S subunit
LVEYIQLCLTCDASNGTLDSYFTGATIKHFTGDKLSKYIHSLPPYKEQCRIVAIVGELMTVCEALKECVRKSQKTQLHLADAVAEQGLYNA